MLGFLGFTSVGDPNTISNNCALGYGLTSDLDCRKFIGMQNVGMNYNQIGMQAAETSMQKKLRLAKEYLQMNAVPAPEKVLIGRR